MIRYEGDFKLLPPALGWAAVIVAAGLVITWGVLAKRFIPDRPREWDFGAVPATPGESIFSTELPEQLWPAPPQLRPPLAPWPAHYGDRSPCWAWGPGDGVYAVDGVDEVDAGKGPEPAGAGK